MSAFHRKSTSMNLFIRVLKRSNFFLKRFFDLSIARNTFLKYVYQRYVYKPIISGTRVYMFYMKNKFKIKNVLIIPYLKVVIWIMSKAGEISRALAERYFYELT